MESKGEAAQSTYLPRRQKNAFAASSNTFAPTTTTTTTTTLPLQSNFRTPKTINPNKAVFTIDAQTCQILIVNNKACQLLGYDSSELHKKKFFDLIKSKSKNSVCALAEMQLDSENGTMVLLSGKVVEMTTKQGTKVAVSLWIRQIDTDGRCLAVAEPVERRVCEIQIDRSGAITSADSECCVLFQYETLNQLVGMDITSLIPAIKLPDYDDSMIPKNVRKQKATGRTADGITFPLCLLIEVKDEAGGGVLNITVWVFQNLSGLIVTDDMGNIQSCNQHFSLLMFGLTQEKIQSMHITSLIPNFAKEVIIMDLPECRSRNLSNSSGTSEEEEEEDEWDADGDASSAPVAPSFQETSSESVSYPAYASEQQQRPTRLTKNESVMTAAVVVDDATTPVNAGGDGGGGNIDFRVLSSAESTPPNPPTINCTPSSPSATFSSSSSSASSVSLKQFNCVEGKFKGEALHADGTPIDILYTVSSQVVLPCGRRIYCIWICRDPDTVFETTTTDRERRNSNLTLTFNSFASSTMDQQYSLGQVIKTTAAAGAATQNTSQPTSVSFVSLNEEEQIAGEFSKHYTTLKQIGKGAYGFVKMAYRNTDRLLVITKFIFKDKLCSHFMVMDDQKKEIPIEIYILKSVKHPNIVSILDVFENENFFQLVMEKHGSGMDLFEFIERRPLMDEKLASYIFRQITNAVDYLHGLRILHRDIKDENIIIDQNFHVKLIDFGSATFMEEGKVFSTFFGTTEYCSPEVLAGNKYAGPELEMWSLGVTLYVIMFFENPFIDVEETLKADLIIPHKVSENLEKLLQSMLNKDPVKRCTIRELVENPWICQEVNPTSFNFVWIVPCESYEAIPEKYFSDRISSSTTALSTISPQEVLSSLVDESSIIENDLDMMRDNEKSAVQKSFNGKTSEKSSWSGNIKDVFSIESLEDDDEEEAEAEAEAETAPAPAERQITRTVSKTSILSNSTCVPAQREDCPFVWNVSAASESPNPFGGITTFSLSQMNVSDFALDKNNGSSALRQKRQHAKLRKDYFESRFMQQSLSKSESNLVRKTKHELSCSELPLGTSSLNNLSFRDLFPIYKNYTNLILNEFSQSQLENSF